MSNLQLKVKQKDAESAIIVRDFSSKHKIKGRLYHKARVELAYPKNSTKAVELSRYLLNKSKVDIFFDEDKCCVIDSFVYDFETILDRCVFYFKGKTVVGEGDVENE